MLCTSYNYVALRLLGENEDSPTNGGCISKARKWILDHGGLTMVPAWGKMTFAVNLFNLYSFLPPFIFLVTSYSFFYFLFTYHFINFLIHFPRLLQILTFFTFLTQKLLEILMRQKLLEIIMRRGKSLQSILIHKKNIFS